MSSNQADVTPIGPAWWNMCESNASWIRRLNTDGPVGQDAIAELRARLQHRLAKAFRGDQRVDANLLEDITQTALLKTLDSLDQFQGRSQLLTWATTIAIRTAYTELRRRHWKDVSLDHSIEQADQRFQQMIQHDDPDDALVYKSMIAEMHRVIQQELTDKQRDALLAELDGMPLAEIARRSGVSLNAVYKLTHDARKRLRQQLEAAGFSMSDLQTA